MNVDALEDFLADHTFDGQGLDTAIDMVFFKVGVASTANKEDFITALDSVPAFHGAFNWRAGGEFSYIHIGAWVGDQRTALVLMAVGVYLGMWQLLSPRTMLNFEDEKAVRDMAALGFLSILAPKKDTQ